VKAQLPAGDTTGAVLLEVILALALFVGAATMLSTALKASMEGVDRRRRQLHADDLAISVLSEIQMGIRRASASGPEFFNAPFDLWSAQVLVQSDEAGPGIASATTHLEVIVRHKESSTVRRLAAWVSAPAAANLRSPSEPPNSAGGVP
jgi:type II secretory pathway pseudopilin PulG